MSHFTSAYTTSHHLTGFVEIERLTDHGSLEVIERDGERMEWVCIG